MEFNLVEGCNYGCRECSHFSPHLRAKRADLETFEVDLRALGDVYRVRRFRFVGGEPLLHRDILDFVRALRASGVTREIEVVTNGSLLPRASDDLFREIDSLSVSWYPDPRCTAEVVDQAADRCRRFGTRLKVRRIDRFRMMQLDVPIDDPRLRADIFATCEIAHSWYCQTFYEGWFYLCSRPLFTDAWLEQRGIAGLEARRVDGIPIHEPDLLPRLTAYLGRDRALRSCEHCLGTVGRSIEWGQMSLAERRAAVPLARNAAESVSPGRLRYLRACSQVERLVWRAVPSVRVSRGLQLLKDAILRA
jgi:hypothetical protein